MQEMYGLAMHDELTGVFNRRFLFEQLTKWMDEGADVGVVLLDLDDFKIVNDHFGHLAGDRVLRDVGMLFHDTTRPDDLVARYGGDEFLFIAQDATPEGLACVAERLTGEIRRLKWTEGETTFGIGVTAGVATSRNARSPTELIAAVDRDLYHRKGLRKWKDAKVPRPADLRDR
jgi:diguanylate cyclase (GGDEF)-like protein